MAQRVCIIGGGVIGLATAYALVRDGFEVTLIEARPTLGSQTSFANGGQLSYRYVAPLADAGVPWQAMGWMLRGDSPLKLRPRMDPAQWRWLASFIAACRGSVNQRNGAHLLRLALLSQATLQQGERTLAYAHMDELTEQLTGAALPLPALFQWLRGLASEVPGWSADLSGHSDGRILAQRLTPLPRAELRIRLQP